MKDLVRTAVLPPLEWARRFHTLPSDPVWFRFSMLVGQYERNTRLWLDGLVTEGAVVCDVGAHVGYYTVAMARRAGPSGRVFAFEPNPATAHLLARNTREFSNVEVVTAAVADFDGTALLMPGGGDSSTFHVVAPSREEPAVPGIRGAEACLVPVVRLDTWARRVGISEVDVVKIDAEGMDLAVVRGMGVLLERSSRMSAMVECAPHLLATAGARVSSLLRELQERFEEVKVIVGPDQALDASEELISSLTRSTRYVNLLARRRP